MEADHQITVGQTKSGKTLFNQMLARGFKARGIKIAVLDPYKDPAWQADYITADPLEFLAVVKNPKQCLQCALFIDEGGQTIGRYAQEMEWATTQARHHGHAAHLISQRAQQISLTVRTQCSVLNCFNINPKDARIYADDFNCPMLVEAAPMLRQGEFIRVVRFQTPRKLAVFHV